MHAVLKSVDPRYHACCITNQAVGYECNIAICCSTMNMIIIELLHGSCNIAICGSTMNMIVIELYHLFIIIWIGVTMETTIPTVRFGGDQDIFQPK